MNNLINNIKNEFENYGILKYKIIERQTQRFVFKNVFDKIETLSDFDCNKTLFLKDKRFPSKVSFTSSQKRGMNKNINKEIESWISNQFKNIQSYLGYSINLSYEYTVDYYTILINGDKLLKQNTKRSMCGILENKYFNSFLIIKDSFLNDNILDKVKDEIISILMCNYKLNDIIQISNEAIAELLNKFIVTFYGDYIYNNLSKFSILDYNKLVLPSYISILSIPRKGIIFDGEGELCSKKEIVSNGILVNIISNNKFAKLLGIKVNGFADLYNNEKIEHQNLKLLLKNRAIKAYATVDDFVESFKNIRYDTKNGIIIADIIYLKNSKKLKKKIKFDIYTFFKNLRADTNKADSDSDNLYLVNCDYTIDYK